MRKRLTAFLLAMCLCFGLAAPAAAQTDRTTVTALVQTDVHILYGGVELIFFDAAENFVCPLNYNDTNYLPVRAVAGLAGLEVDWDAATQTVVLTSSDGEVDQYHQMGSISGMNYKAQAILDPNVTITLDGEEQTLTDARGDRVYAINYNGTNYLPLRAVAEMVGFDVDWDGSTKTVTLTPPALLANKKEITDDNIREIIYGLKEEYPEGRPWTNDNVYHSAIMHTTGYGCVGFALICSDAAFGILPATETHSVFENIRVGDMIRMDHDTHTVIVLEVRANSIIVAEGNFNSSIHWGREITRSELEAGGFVVTTRYPA